MAIPRPRPSLRSALAAAVLPLAACMLAAAPRADAPPPAADAAPRAVRVAVFPDPPFAMQDAAGRWTGFSMMVLDAAAADARLVLEMQPCNSLQELFRAVADGKADIGAGNTFVTLAHLDAVDFTQPTLDGGLRVMVPSERSHSFGRIWDGLVGGGHVAVIAWGAAITVAVSVVLVAVLRRVDREFTRHWHEGFAEALYHVVSVTVTGKTSYKGSIAPGWVGRLVAAAWLVFGVASVAYVTSSLSSVMTATALRSSIHGPADLRGRKVGTLDGSVGDRYCAEHGIDVVRFRAVDEAAAALAAREVDAVVADAQSLEWFDTSHPDVPVDVVGELFERRHYGFPVHRGDDDLRRRVDAAILSLREGGGLDRIRVRWFGH